MNNIQLFPLYLYSLTFREKQNNQIKGTHWNIEGPRKIYLGLRIFPSFIIKFILAGTTFAYGSL